MDIVKRVRTLAEELFTEGPFSDCFVIEVQQNSPRGATLFFDSDSGVTLEKCSQLSRALERRLDDEDAFDGEYMLDVSSPGVDRPLLFWRQYPRHVGRTLQVMQTDGTVVVGVLKSVGVDTITLQTGKQQTADIVFSDIEKSFVQISF